SATHLELLDQRRRNMLQGSCNDYCVERTAFRPNLITVTDLDAHIVMAEVSQQFRRDVSKRWNDLNGTDFLHQPRQYCGLVSGTGAYFQDHMVAFDLSEMRHEGDYDWL